MNVTTVNIAGFHEAVEAMRYSFESECTECTPIEDKGIILFQEDVSLLKKLIVAGDSHSKVCRMIEVWAVVEMPRYWWSEMDTYAVGKSQMSTSTVHTILKKIKKGELTEANFHATTETGKKAVKWFLDAMYGAYNPTIEDVKEALPESFLQKRMVHLNYQTIRHIYFDRKNHRLKIWHTFLEELLSQLPFNEFITCTKEAK